MLAWPVSSPCFRWVWWWNAQMGVLALAGHAQVLVHMCDPRTMSALRMSCCALCKRAFALCKACTTPSVSVFCVGTHMYARLSVRLATEECVLCLSDLLWPALLLLVFTPAPLWLFGAVCPTGPLLPIVRPSSLQAGLLAGFSKPAFKSPWQQLGCAQVSAQPHGLLSNRTWTPQERSRGQWTVGHTIYCRHMLHQTAALGWAQSIFTAERISVPAMAH